MSPPTLRFLPAVLFALAAGCASTSLLPDEDRIRLARDLEGKVLHLRASNHVMPFFTDSTRRLISPLPPDSIELLVDPSGQPILPGEPEGLLTLGSKVRVEKVEFPTSLVVTRRPLYSPRTVPWIYLSVVGQPHSRPFVAVLRQGIKTREEFVSAVDQILCEKDPTPNLEAYPPELRAAIRDKRLEPGMDAHAVTLAWGRPESIRQEWVEGVKSEVWTWPLGKRTAAFRDGKLVSAEPSLR
ncbi:MAG: hypothetical protein ACOX6T_20330 [Myxococcales bacterium]|jgi:hypothetical protein